MAIAPNAPAPAVEERAARSRGTSQDAIYRMVERALEEAGVSGGTLADVGCGTGNLWRRIGGRFHRYLGVDVVRYDDFPAGQEFLRIDLDSGRLPLADNAADVTAAVETIEHLENPRAFLRELFRVTRPGGWVAVTTPNQLSLLSLITLAVKQQHSAFQEPDYPAHITPLIEADLRRIAAECGLESVRVRYSGSGRLICTGRHYPAFLSSAFPRACSDNVLMLGRKPSLR